MLQSMRSGLFSKLFMAILITGGLGLMLMDWQGVYSGAGMGGSDVARIGKDRITLNQFDRQVQKNLQNLPISPQQAYQSGIIQQTLQQVVSGRMIEMTATQAGLEVGRDQLAVQLRTLLSPFMSEGVSSKEALQRLAQLSGVSEAELLEDLKRREAARLLLEPIGRATAISSDTLAADFARIAGEQRKLITLTLPHTRITDVKTPSEDELATHYKLMESKYTIPEKRTAKVIVIDAEKVGATIPVSDEDVAAFYEENKDAFALDQRRSLAQIVTDDKDALDKLKAGLTKDSDFKAEAAKAGLADKYLTPGDFKAKDLPDTISGPVFKAENGDIVGPLQSDLGWHLIKISGVKGASHRTLDEARDDIKAQIRQEQVAARMETIANELDDALAGGATVEEAIKDLPVTIFDLKSVTAKAGEEAETLKGFAEADRQNIFETTFAAEEGEAAPLFALSDGRYATVVVDEIMPSSVPPLAEKRDEVLASWQDSQRQQENLKQAAEMLKDLKDGKADLPALAKTTGIATRTLTVRGDKEPPAPLTMQTVDQVLTGGVDEYVLVNDVDFVTLAKVENITFATTKDIAGATQEAARSAETGRFQDAVYQALLANAQKEGNVRYNQLLLERVYNKAPAEEAQ